MAGPTLEQKRAQDAWSRCENCGDEYVKLAKGLPALIMNSGLMQVMAFLHDKGNKGNAHERLASDLRGWLNHQCGVPSDFTEFMEKMLKSEASEYQAVTAEAFAWLKWLRQMAAARQQVKGG